MTGRCRALALLLLVAAAAWCPAAWHSAAAQDLRGHYALAGETAAGAPYKGAVAIAARGQAFDVDWDGPVVHAARGFALKLDNVLGVAAEDGDEDFGIVLYRVKGGHLEGIWQGNLSRYVVSLGREDLDGPDALEGEFKITLGQNPDGSNYVGAVTIHKTGRVYQVDWRTPTPRYVGTGVLVGDVFVVGYSSHRRSGVAAYCVRSTQVVEGVTALPDDSVLGAEQFWSAAASPPADHLAALRQGGNIGDCGAPIVERAVPPGKALASLH